MICLSVFLDGLSTTSPTLLFCLYCLATNHRVQEKLYNEIVDVVGNDPATQITTKHIAKLSYLKAFVKETFRWVKYEYFWLPKYQNSMNIKNQYWFELTLRLFYIMIYTILKGCGQMARRSRVTRIMTWFYRAFTSLQV